MTWYNYVCLLVIVWNIIYPFFNWARNHNVIAFPALALNIIIDILLPFNLAAHALFFHVLNNTRAWPSSPLSKKDKRLRDGAVARGSRNMMAWLAEARGWAVSVTDSPQRPTGHQNAPPLGALEERASRPDTVALAQTHLCSRNRRNIIIVEHAPRIHNFEHRMDTVTFFPLPQRSRESEARLLFSAPSEITSQCSR